LSSSFVYKKEKNSSDALLKKLIQMMEVDFKKIYGKSLKDIDGQSLKDIDDGKNRDDGIVVEEVDEDLEHTIEDLEESGVI
jgi:hypothetical protein